MQIINANPNQTISLCAFSVDGYGAAADGYQPATLDYILLPSGSFAIGYPQAMTRVSKGTYRINITLPSTLGTYLAGITFADPVGGRLKNDLYMINISRPFGNSSVNPGL